VSGSGGRPLLNIPAVKDPAERISLTLGQDFRRQLIPAAGERAGLKLSGFVSRPEFTRSNASQMYVYVNGRFVKDYLLNHAVMTAYRRLIEPRRYPSWCSTWRSCRRCRRERPPARWVVRPQIYALSQRPGSVIGAGLGRG
jgi:DNA mismatch repair ATPase MutL